MTDDASRDAGSDETYWQSPRWREGDAQQGDVEREHRFRDGKHWRSAVRSTGRGASGADSRTDPRLPSSAAPATP